MPKLGERATGPVSTQACMDDIDGLLFEHEQRRRLELRQLPVWQAKLTELWLFRTQVLFREQLDVEGDLLLSAIAEALMLMRLRINQLTRLLGTEDDAYELALTAWARSVDAALQEATCGASQSVVSDRLVAWWEA